MTMELRFETDEDRIKRIQEREGIAKAADVAREGIAFLDWASEQRESGYRVASIDASGNVIDTPRMVRW